MLCNSLLQIPACSQINSHAWKLSRATVLRCRWETMVTLSDSIVVQLLTLRCNVTHLDAHLTLLQNSHSWLLRKVLCAVLYVWSLVSHLCAMQCLTFVYLSKFLLGVSTWSCQHCTENWAILGSYFLDFFVYHATGQGFQLDNCASYGTTFPCAEQKIIEQCINHSFRVCHVGGWDCWDCCYTSMSHTSRSALACGFRRRTNSAPT